MDNWRVHFKDRQREPLIIRTARYKVIDGCYTFYSQLSSMQLYSIPVDNVHLVEGISIVSKEEPESVSGELEVQV